MFGCSRSKQRNLVGGGGGVGGGDRRTLKKSTPRVPRRHPPSGSQARGSASAPELCAPSFPPRKLTPVRPGQLLQPPKARRGEGKTDPGEDGQLAPAAGTCQPTVGSGLAAEVALRGYPAFASSGLWTPVCPSPRLKCLYGKRRAQGTSLGGSAWEATRWAGLGCAPGGDRGASPQVSATSSKGPAYS